MPYKESSHNKFQVKPEPGQIVKVYYPEHKKIKYMTSPYLPAEAALTHDFGEVIKVFETGEGREKVLLKQLFKKYEINEVDFFFDHSVCTFKEGTIL